MKSSHWIVNFLIGIFIVGALIIGLFITSLFILPGVAVLIIAIPIYYWLKNKQQNNYRNSPEEKEKTLSSSGYTVLDEHNKRPDR